MQSLGNQPDAAVGAPADTDPQERLSPAVPVGPVRPIFAATAVKDTPIGELVTFDYKGHGYPLTHK